MDAGLKLSIVAIMLNLNIQNDTIEQLQVGIYTIATALLCKASTLVIFDGKMGVAHAGIAPVSLYSQMIITIRECFLVNLEK